MWRGCRIPVREANGECCAKAIQLRRRLRLRQRLRLALGLRLSSWVHLGGG